MKRFLAPIVLLTFLFPSFAYGDGLICKVTGWNCPEVVDIQDLVRRDGRYYQKFTQVPFTGKTTGRRQGLMQDGKWDGPFVGYHKNGQLDDQGIYKDGKKEGPWVYYHENGQLDDQGIYKDGKKEGLWVSYRENGTLYTQEMYKDGKREDGIHVTYHYNGKIWQKKTYKNDQVDGPYSSYHENGQLRSKGNYQNHRRHGPWVFFDEKGMKKPRSPNPLIEENDDNFFRQFSTHEGSGTYRNGKNISD